MLRGPCFRAPKYLIGLVQNGEAERANELATLIRRDGNTLRLQAAIVGYMFEYDAMLEVAHAVLHRGIDSIPYQVKDLTNE